MSYLIDAKGVIGIDLGASFCRVGIYRNDKFIIIPDENGNTEIPSYVSFTETEVLVGRKALENSLLHPSNTIFDITKMIGKKYSELRMKFCPFKIIDCEGRPKIGVVYKNAIRQYHLEEVFAIMLLYLKNIAEKYLKKNVKKAVISVPSTSSDSQRRGIKDAGQISGLSILRIGANTALSSFPFYSNRMEEKCHERDEEIQNVLVIDIGGGSLEACMIVIEEGIFEVKSVSGTTNLGGRDIDYLLFEKVVEEFKRRDPSFETDKLSKSATMKLLRDCERAKIELSSLTRSKISLNLENDDKELIFQISRPQFEQMILSKMGRTLLRCISSVFDGCGEEATKESTNSIILVGGTTKIPKLQQLIRDYFDFERRKEQNEPLRILNFQDRNCNVYGTSLCGGILCGRVKDILVLDVYPFNMLARRMKCEEAERRVIPKNRTYPLKMTETYEIEGYDWRSEEKYLELELFEEIEGSLSVDEENTTRRKLGNFEIARHYQSGGKGRMEVTFSIDANGILWSYARDTSCRERVGYTLKKENALSLEEMEEAMVRIGTRPARYDERSFMNIQAKNQLESYCYCLKNFMDGETQEAEKLERMKEEEKRVLGELVEETISWLDKHQGEIRVVYFEKLKHVKDFVLPILKRLEEQEEQEEEEEGEAIFDLDVD